MTGPLISKPKGDSKGRITNRESDADKNVKYLICAAGLVLAFVVLAFVYFGFVY